VLPCCQRAHRIQDKIVGVAPSSPGERVKIGVEWVEGHSCVHDERRVVVAARLDLPVPARVMRHTVEEEWPDDGDILPQRADETATAAALELPE
jgi:hypothetical protein